MASIVPSKPEKRLRPVCSVEFVGESGTTTLSADEISSDNIGLKACGLASLPPAWTLPFLTISADLYKSYSKEPKRRSELLRQWSNLITVTAERVGIERSDHILVRSSGCAEGISGRGRFYSANGILQNVESVLNQCLRKLSLDDDLQGERIPLLIQKQCEPVKARGHLSNERWCFKENRDWMGEFESADAERSGSFQINLRHWRNKPPQNVREELFCAISPRIAEVLKTPAEWAYSKQARVHYEWVWNGRTVYLVQADEESLGTGHDPVQEHGARDYVAVSFTPQCLRPVTAKDASNFSKIGNVFIYLNLTLPIAPLYILEDQETIGELAQGKVPSGLLADITAMVKGSLVIRTDIDTDELRAKQLLPRTQEMRSAPDAIKWIVKQSKQLTKLKQRSAFIFHNFIPAQSAAFAYADPNEPFVQIEALWGLPEGLYYNSHDKYVVDTIAPDLDSLRSSDVARFIVREKKNYKRFFVSTTPSGKWETLPLSPPYDWKGSLLARDCRTIAYESRRIACAEKRAVSIMWFVGVPKATAVSSVIPWYHEPFDIHTSRASIISRTKTSFDKCFIVRSENDIADLQAGLELNAPQSRIRVQPFDEKLLRDKHTLRKIGELAKKMGATIVLEGAVLSHAYYQLLDTGAIVEVVHPFIGFDETHAFNKLVRDGVPELIRKRGESVTTATLDEESLVRALREKLVEESFEVLDAKDCKSIVAELADLKEVVDALLQHLQVSDDQLKSEQLRKHAARGGFSKGIVLVETRSALPTSKSQDSVQPHLDGLQPDASAIRAVDDAGVRRRNEAFEKRSDRRVAEGKVEVQINLAIPVTSGAWSAETAEERIDGSGGKTAKGRVKGARKGSHWNVEVTVSIDETQPELL